jgi:tetratricopeptide (TPR) repeat protein
MFRSGRRFTGYGIVGSGAFVMLVSGSMFAQDAAPPRDAGATKRERHEGDHPHHPAPYDDEVPSSIAEDLAGTELNRTWGPRYHLNADPQADRRARARRYLRPTQGPRCDDEDYTYRFGVPSVYDDYVRAQERAYRQGVADGRNAEQFDLQAQRGVYMFDEAMTAGDAAFLHGQYAAAARYFRLAARLNEGDPTSRLSFAHAMFALGHYGEAARSLRRAFDLEPKIAYLPLDLRGAYGRPADFDDHLTRLRRAVKAAQDEKTPDEASLQFVLGYTLFFSTDPVEGAVALVRAARLRRGDRVYQQLAEVSRQSVPAHALKAFEDD